jgi:hypothetical protein
MFDFQNQNMPPRHPRWRTPPNYLLTLSRRSWFTNCSYQGMRNPALSPEDDPVEQLQDASYNRRGLELSQNFESLRTRVGSILVGCGIVSFLDGCSERKRAPHSKSSSRRKIQRREAEGAEVNSFNLSLVPLRQASLCLDCETITTAQTNCHACGSRALLNVSQVLDRQLPSDLSSSERTVVCPRGIFHRDVPNPCRSRNRGNTLPLKLDFSMSENNA